jgi:hypothetical protein
LTADTAKDKKLNSGQTGETSGGTDRYDYDGFWKDLIDKFFYYLLKRTIPELCRDADRNTKPKFLDKEFRDILNTADPEIHTSPRFADYLLEVPLKGGGAERVLLHFEVQGHDGGDITERMYHYKCLIYAHYRREPAPLVILTEKRPKKEPRCYSHIRYGTKTLYEFNYLSLPDLRDEELLASDNPADLALYAAKCALKSKKELQKYNYLRKLLELLGERGWDRYEKRELLLFIERILYLKDEKLEAQYVEYRQRLNKEGKCLFLWENVKWRMRSCNGALRKASSKLPATSWHAEIPRILYRRYPACRLPPEKIRELMN